MKNPLQYEGIYSANVWHDNCLYEMHQMAERPENSRGYPSLGASTTTRRPSTQGRRFLFNPKQPKLWFLDPAAVKGIEC